MNAPRDYMLAAFRRFVWRQRFLRAFELSLNERAKVEQELFNVANSKAPLPDREQCRKWALRLGVPADWAKQR